MWHPRPQIKAVCLSILPAGRPEFLERCRLMVAELKKVQDSYGNGYLGGHHAFPLVFVGCRLCLALSPTPTHGTPLLLLLLLQPRSPFPFSSAWRRWSPCGFLTT